MKEVKSRRKQQADVAVFDAAPQSTTSRGLPAVDMTSRGQHHGTFSRLGNIVMNSAASGFGFTLGGNAANSLWSSLFGRH